MTFWLLIFKTFSGDDEFQIIETFHQSHTFETNHLNRDIFIKRGSTVVGTEGMPRATTLIEADVRSNALMKLKKKRM